MILQIWILKKSIEQLKKNCSSWIKSEDISASAVRYTTVPPKASKDWICVQITLDDYTRLTDNELLYE